MMMRTTPRSRWIAALAVAAVSLAACADKSTTEEDAGRATITPIAGTDLSSVTLSEAAVKRIGIQMDTVQEGDGSKIEIPYAAVLYDPDGNTWTFTPKGELSFVRAPITVDHIEGDVAFLSDGPPVGTDVVTVGAAELYGAEIGVGDE